MPSRLSVKTGGAAMRQNAAWSIRCIADAVLALHLAFILFVALGALAVVRWPRLVWLHLPAVAWGACVEITGRLFSLTCPLTPFENRLRALGGDSPYAGDFIAHYLLPVIYPQGLTRELQLALGIAVPVLNAAAYGFVYWRRRRK